MTSAKISLLQGTRLSTIAKRQSPQLVRHYVEGNREGQAWLTEYCAEREVDVLHGSRFDADGTVLEGPATSDVFSERGAG